MFVGMGANSPSGYNITDSLRFRSSASTYLSRTPSSAGNRKTFTLSFWFKRGNVSGAAQQSLFSAGTGTTDSTFFQCTITTGNLLYFQTYSGNLNLVTTQVFRDPSAWYHVVIAVDTTQATASNRAKLYVNGSQVTAFNTANYPTQNLDTAINNATEHNIGRNIQASGVYYYDGYMTEFNLVDGQALDPTSFGETNDDGVWSPKEYTGTYGTNGFYLPMKETTQADGFNTVTFTGTNATQSISNVGFSPDLVWFKNRSGANNHALYDTVRGRALSLISNATNSDITSSAGNDLASFDSNGFTVGPIQNHTSTNGSGQNIVAWCWDAGSSTVSNTDGTITSSVRANPATGFSVVTYTGDANASATVGHGLGSAPEVVIVKRRDNAANWAVWHQNLSSYTHKLYLNTTDAEATGGNPIDAAPTSTVLELSSSGNSNASGGTYVAYCFSEVSGYSKFGSYTGNGSTSGPTVTTGFRPAFVMFKRTDSASNWLMIDSTRSTYLDKHIHPNLSNAESTASAPWATFSDTGFTLTSAFGETNASGGTYIYMAFADTRDFQWNFDSSGNKNNWTPNNINSNASSETTYDLMSDVPHATDEDTGNYPTCNPLRGDDFNATYSNGNMTATLGSSSVTGMGTANWHIPTTGKWYWEVTIGNFSQWCALGIRKANATLSDWLGYTANDYSISQPGITKHNDTTYDASYTNTNIASGDVFGVAFDADNGTLKFYQNGADLGTAFTGLTDEYLPAFSGSSSVTQTLNFGQQPFRYSLPTGYKKLNTYNLPDSSITDGSDYMNTVLYTGNGTSQSITGVGFSPDLVWTKERGGTSSHMLFDTIRGAGYGLRSELTNAEFNDIQTVSSIDSDGFSVGNSLATNESGIAHVSWNWRGSDSTAVSNTDGTITSTVSANTTSGFSVVTYTGNGTNNASVGHGLGNSADVVIVKQRDGTYRWITWHSILGNDHRLHLDGTEAYASSSLFVRSSNATTFTLGTANNVNANGSSFVAYCFAEVEGFSKFGSYTGNGSTDGPFVYLGFRPKFVMIKNTSAIGFWQMIDNTRDPYNVTDSILYANTSGAEATATARDHLSNGFKIRNTFGSENSSGNVYIYMAFAENPFKNSLAR